MKAKQAIEHYKSAFRGQASTARELPLLYISRTIYSVAAEQKWGAKDVGIFNRMADAMLVELCEMPCRCKGKQVCKKCKGTGSQRLTKSARAKMLQISNVSYAQTWHSRWQKVLEELLSD